MTNIVHEALSERREQELAQLQRMENDLMPLVEQGEAARRELDQQRARIDDLSQAIELFDTAKTSEAAIRRTVPTLGPYGARTEVRGD